jgi:hypothetical protein
MARSILLVRRLPLVAGAMSFFYRRSLRSFSAGAMFKRMTSDIRTLIDRLAALRAQSVLLWDAAVDTASTPERQAVAVDDRRNALDAWALALSALDGGRVDGPEDAAEALQQARSLAQRWGDDAPERAALLALAQAVLGAE